MGRGERVIGAILLEIWWSTPRREGEEHSRFGHGGGPKVGMQLEQKVSKEERLGEVGGPRSLGRWGRVAGWQGWEPRDGFCFCVATVNTRRPVLCVIPGLLLLWSPSLPP